MDKAVFKHYRWIIGLVILIWLMPLLLIYYSPLDDFTKRGQFGDMFGVANALFTGLAFAFVVITLLEQQKQLKEQERQMVRRDFESVFFELLKMHNENVKEAFAKDEAGRKVDGIAAFGIFWKKLLAMDGIVGVIKRLGLYTSPMSADALGDCYVRFYETDNHEQILGNYFRTLYQLMTYILQQDELGVDEKYKYAKIVRARMSRDELALLFFNGLSEYGENSVEYIETFSMLKHLDLGKLQIANPKDHYAASAFGRG